MENIKQIIVSEDKFICPVCGEVVLDKWSYDENIISCDHLLYAYWCNEHEFWLVDMDIFESMANAAVESAKKDDYLTPREFELVKKASEAYIDEGPESARDISEYFDDYLPNPEELLFDDDIVLKAFDGYYKNLCMAFRGPDEDLLF
jgi:hypothetical protein